jgi:hypothetical protein
MLTLLKQARSGLSLENLQESFDADQNAANGGMAQYFTPENIAEKYQTLLPARSPVTILDPQCGQGALIRLPGQYGIMRFGCELDSRINYLQGVQLITANCQKVFELVADLYPELRWVCINANVPFGRKWKLPDGSWIDSTLATWRFAVEHGNYGYFIAGRATIEKLGIKAHPWVFHYDTVMASEWWANMRDTTEIGVVCWKRPEQDRFTPQSYLFQTWNKITEIIEEERISRPDFNIYLDDTGKLRTYLSQRGVVKLKLSKEQIAKLLKINDCAPLTLTTEKASRMLLRELVDAGIYIIQPEALATIESALAEVNSLACPIMPVSDFSAVAWADEEDVLLCIKDVDAEGVRLSITFSRMCQRLGIMGKSFHSLRHAAATEKHKGTDKAALTAKLASVLSLAEIKQLLGHASAKTTKKYVH